MPCSSCGTEHPGWGKHCNACGAQLEEPGLACVGCQTCNPIGSKFCGGCGQKLELVLCLQCGARNTLERSICVQCHRPLRRSIAATEHRANASVLPSAREEHHWKAEEHLVVRVVPEGIADLVHSSAREAAQYLEDFRETVRSVVSAHGGDLQTSEDGGLLLSFPCLSDDIEAQADTAVDAARAMHAALQTLANDRQREGWDPMPARIAVHFAEYLAADSVRSESVLTRVENEGPDLLKLCPSGEICLSEPVQRAVQSRYLDRPIGFLGRGDGPRVGAFVLGEERARLPGSEVGAFEATPLVGRERELSHIKRRWNDVIRGGGSRFLTLLAEPGLGRNRLSEAFLKSVRSHSGCFYVTTCEESSTLAPYHPIADLLGQMLDVAPDDDDDTVALRLMLAARDAVAASEGWASQQHEPDMIEVSVVLGELLGVDLASRERYLEPSILDPDSLRQRTFFNVLKLLRGLSRQAPRVLVVEDVHLADSASLDLLRYLGSMLRGGGNLFVLCTGLPSFLELNPKWGQGWWRHETMSLSAVSEEDVENLVRALLGTSCQEEVVQKIVKRARGRPGVGELLGRAWLEEQGAFLAAAEGELDELSVEMVFSTLARGSRATAEGAAGVEADLAEFEALGEPEAEGAGEAASGDGSKGASPEPPAGRDGDEPATPAPTGSMEYHLDADDDDLEEGATVIMTYRDDDESGGVDRAFSPEKPLGALEHLLPGEVWQRRLSRLSESARRLLAIASIAGRTFRGEMLVAQWKACGEDVTLLEPLLGDLRSVGLLRRRVEPRRWQVSWRFRSTLLHRVVYDFIPMTERHTLHRQLARQLESENIGARVRTTYALVAYHYDQGGESDRALRYYVMGGKRARRALGLSESERLFVRALDLMKETGFPDGGTESIALHHMLGQIFELLNDRKRALSELETALEFARVRQDPRLECEVLMSLCDLLDREGDHSRLLELALQARGVAEESGSSRMLVRSLRRIGWEHLRAGRQDEGRIALEEAVKVALKTGKPEELTIALDSLGAFYYVRGNYGLAVRGYEDLLTAIKRSIRQQGPTSSKIG